MGSVIALSEQAWPGLAERVWHLVQEGRPFAAPGAPTSDSVEVVLRSSGSGAVAKNVGHTYSGVTAAVAAGDQVLGRHRWLLLLSPVSAGGFVSLARSRSEPLVWPGLGRRFDAAAVAAWYPGTATALSVVSTQLARLLDHAAHIPLSMDVVLVGGGPFPQTLRERCASIGVNAIGTYGATETLGGCVYDGVPLPGVTVTIDEEQICFAGAQVAPTYVPGPTIPTPWPSGDLGRWTNGKLEVVGRLDDQVSVKGINVNLADVEREALCRPGVVEAVAVAVPDERDGYRVEVFVEDAEHALPRLPTGKPDRQELLRRARGDSQ